MLFIKIKISIPGKTISIQSNIEVPEVYILARCPANDQQLAYSNIRLEDIKDMTSKNIEIDGLDFKDS